MINQLPFSHAWLTHVHTSRNSVNRTVELAEKVNCTVATLSDERPMEGKHFENRNSTTFTGVFGGNNGRYPGLMSMIASSDYLMEYADSNLETNCESDLRRARRRHKKWGEAHQTAIGHPTPLATPSLKSDPSVSSDTLVPKPRSSIHNTHILRAVFDEISVSVSLLTTMLRIFLFVERERR